MYILLSSMPKVMLKKSESVILENTTNPYGRIH